MLSINWAYHVTPLLSTMNNLLNVCWLQDGKQPENSRKRLEEGALELFTEEYLMIFRFRVQYRDWHEFNEFSAIAKCN
jgi:hypothetical protein